MAGLGLFGPLTIRTNSDSSLQYAARILSSAIGTFRTSREVRLESAFRGKRKTWARSEYFAFLTQTVLTQRHSEAAPLEEEAYRLQMPFGMVIWSS